VVFQIKRRSSEKNRGRSGPGPFRRRLIYQLQMLDPRDWQIVVALGLVPQLTYTAFKILGI